MAATERMSSLVTEICRPATLRPTSRTGPLHALFRFSCIMCVYNGYVLGQRPGSHPAWSDWVPFGDGLPCTNEKYKFSLHMGAKGKCTLKGFCRGKVRSLRRVTL